MPPRWPRKPDRADPAYRKLDDRMNFAVHVAIFAAVNSGLWFFRTLGATSELGAPGGFAATPLVTEVWSLLLVAHAIFIFAIAKYPEATPQKLASSGKAATKKATLSQSTTSKSSPSKATAKSTGTKPKSKKTSKTAPSTPTKSGTGFQPSSKKDPSAK